VESLRLRNAPNDLPAYGPKGHAFGCKSARQCNGWFIYRPFGAENRRRFTGADFWPREVRLLHPVRVNPRFRQLLPASLLLLSATSVPLLIWSPTGLARLEALEQQRKGLQLEVQRLEREIDRLRVQAESVKTSPASIERVARDELGLVRQTELVMQFKKD
jgi:cell division protein FtsB